MPSLGKGSKVADLGGSSSLNSALGWASYADGQYTSGSPLVISQGNTAQITNNAASVIDSQLPTGVTTFYDSATGELVPDTVGDMYMFRIDFKAYSSSQTGYGELSILIDGVTEILNFGVTFARGTGLANAKGFSRTSAVYSLDSFVANRAIISYESIRGTSSIYDIVFIPVRVVKGRS